MQNLVHSLALTVQEFSAKAHHHENQAIVHQLKKVAVDGCAMLALYAITEFFAHHNRPALADIFDLATDTVENKATNEMYAANSALHFAVDLGVLEQAANVLAKATQQTKPAPRPLLFVAPKKPEFSKGKPRPTGKLSFVGAKQRHR